MMEKKYKEKSIMQENKKGKRKGSTISFRAYGEETVHSYLKKCCRHENEQGFLLGKVRKVPSKRGCEREPDKEEGT